MTSQTPVAIVTDLLDRLAADDVSGALENVDDDIAYTNVSFPTVYGKRKVAKIFGGMARRSWAGFDYRMVNASAEGPVVLTERIDELRFGRVAIRFWVCGRFEIAEGRIIVWRDYFDYFDMTKAIVRGLLGVLVPGVLAPMPEALAATAH